MKAMMMKKRMKKRNQNQNVSPLLDNSQGDISGDGRAGFAASAWRLIIRFCFPLLEVVSYLRLLGCDIVLVFQLGVLA